MTLAATFVLNCDACHARITTTSQQDITDDLTIPERKGMLGMDLCPSCLEMARAAVRGALGLAPASANHFPAPARRQ